MEKRALFVGLTTIDIQFFTEVYPEPNQKIKTEMPFLSAGGPAANAAITYSFLGGKVDFLTCIGKNDFSKIINADFLQHSVNVIDTIQNEESEPIISAIITTTSNSERTIFTHYPEKMEIEGRYIVDDIEKYDFIFTDGFYPELSVPICRIAHQKGIPVIFDGGSWKPQLPEILPYVDIAICSNNFKPPHCKNKAEIFEYLKSMGISEMAISRGQESVLLTTDYISVNNVNAVDSLGAGDILHGAFCYFFDEKLPFKQSVAKASQIATFSTRYKGTRSWMNYFDKDNVGLSGIL